MKLKLFGILVFFTLGLAWATGQSAPSQSPIETLIDQYPKTSAASILQAIQTLEAPASPNYKKANEMVTKAWELAGQGKKIEAFRLLARAAVEVPKHEYYLFSVSSLLFWHLFDYDGTLAFADASFQVNKSPFYLAYKGLAYFRKGDKAMATQSFDQAVKGMQSKPFGEANKKSDLIAVLGWYAYFLSQTSEPEAALKIAQTAQDLDPQNTDWYVHDGGGNAAFLLANRNFGARIYQKAVDYYKIAIAYLQVNKDRWAQMQKYSDPELLLKLAQDRLALKTQKPKTVFKILFTAIKGADVDYVDSKGKRRKSTNTLSSEWRQAAIDNFLMLGPLFESLSKGQWGLQIDIADYDGRVVGLTENPFVELGQETEIINIDLNQIEPPMGAFWQQNLQKYDGFALYWDGTGIVDGGTGGLSAYPLIPYGINSPLRAMINIPTTNVPSPETYIYFMHEVFHNLEGLIGLSPTHGFRDGVRESFKDWKGKTELDYYQWIFATRIAQNTALGLDGSPLSGFETLSALNRYSNNSDLIYKNYATKINALKLADRKKASEALAKANNLYYTQQKPAEAEPLYKEALKLNPYLFEAQSALGKIALNRSNPAEALGYFKGPASVKLSWWDIMAYANALRDGAKNFGEAQKWYVEALNFTKVPAEKSETQFQWAEALRAAKNDEEALDHYTASIDLFSKVTDQKSSWFLPQALYYHSQIRMKVPDSRSEGFDDFDLLCRNGQSQPWFFENLFYEIFWLQKDFDYGEKILDLQLEFTKKGPDQAKIYIAQGRLHYEGQDHDLAMRSFETAYKLAKAKSPEAGEALFWQGFVDSYGLGNGKKGLQKMKQGFAMGYNNDWAKGIIDGLDK